MSRWVWGVAALCGVLVVGWWLARPAGAPDQPGQDREVTSSDGRPNVLILMWDTVRADRMSLYGHDRPTTPHLDAFATSARVYDNATSPAMWTLPSHATVFTGRYPTTHGARAGYRWLDHHHDTLAELLLESGYETFLFSSNLIAGSLTNLTQGFSVVHTTYPRAHRQPGPWPALADRATHAKLIARDASTEISPAFAGRRDDHWPKSVYKDAAPIIAQGLLGWLDERDEPARPWFAYLNMMEAHTPRVPSMAARKRVMDDATIELGLVTDVSLFAENEYMIGERDYSEDELGAIRGVYDAALVDLDDATKLLIDALEERGELDDTVVILMSDHGEQLGEHRRFEHRWSLHQPLLHVPLVIRYPAGVPAGRVSDRVSTADVFSTVLELTGVPEPAGTQTRSLLAPEPSEHVFAQLLDPYASQLRNVREAYAGEGIDYAPLLRTGCAAFQSGDKYLHWSDGNHALYDLVSDPGERVNRIDAEPQRALGLARALFTWEQALPAYDPERRRPADRRSKAQRQERVEERQLALLGYVTDDDGDDDLLDSHRARCGPEEAP